MDEPLEPRINKEGRPIRPPFRSLEHPRLPELSITLNGSPRQVPAPLTLAGLLDHLGLDPRAVVVEQNRAIVRRPQLGEIQVSEGDMIELVHFVGGG